MMNDLAAEKAVIGACLVEGDAIGAARQFVARAFPSPGSHY